MCGIVGFRGKTAVKGVMQGLKHLEYRGYDSAGIACIMPLITSEKSTKSTEMKVVKTVGEIKKLEDAINGIDFSSVSTAIGHTRWATHGAPSTVNAHPHTDCKNAVALVHNGIIENYLQLKKALAIEGHKFRSETDTEIAAHLIEKHYNGDPVEALRKALGEIRGSYAFVFLHKNHPDKIFFARNQSPLIIGVGKGRNLVASDAPAVLEYTRSVIYLEDGDFGWVSDRAFEIYDSSGKKAERKTSAVAWSIEDAQKSGYPHYTLKEIFETPKAIVETLLSRVSLSPPYSRLEVPDDLLREAKTVRIVACGTSYHAGLVGKYVIEALAGIPVSVDLASEHRYSPVDDDSLLIFITQSGETADTLACARLARQKGKKAIAITNVVGSSITRECPHSLLIHAGPEKGVAATKTYTSQIVLLSILALRIGELKGRIDPLKARHIVGQIRALPQVVQKILDDAGAIEKAAKQIAKADHVFFIGRGVGYPAALEGALKLKEISYIAAEGYAAGELKHGPFALLCPDSPVIAVVCKGPAYEKMLGSLGEVRARGSKIYAVADEGDEEIVAHADFVIRMPKTDPLLSAIPMGVVLQLLSYYAARERGCPIDKPRNLAKSVTVE
ncbi:MAG: glutamine--fructose-6-phosphate transaminase (isomerizing) [Thermoplasmata archaeon HGW-Thermoplasmata-2]|nr:MAG: glutamine--fructose-6-phosphate transaminase (isomerizing) [Thermoplasmata archaeon HGW-Thermoplasmata-2]